MKKKNLIITAVIILLIISNGFLIYKYILKKSGPVESNNNSGLYICPMHPQIQQNSPGVCPICNMELVLKNELDENELSDSDDIDKEIGEIKLSPSEQVLANVKVQPVELGTLENMIEVNGAIRLRDDAIVQISSPVKGKITKLYINYEGQRVSKGQKAFEIYSPELISTQREFLIAYENYLSSQKSDNQIVNENAASLLDAARQRLQLWFVDDSQINELMESGKILNSLTYYSDKSGIVTKKYFNEGSWVMEGSTIVDITDISSVWTMAYIYEKDAGRIKNNMQAEIIVSGYPDKPLFGKIDYINSVINPDTRTFEARITTPNPGYILKPEMFVKVKIETDIKSNLLLIPKTALLKTGKSDIVYIRKKDNIFAPREVETGIEQNGLIQIKSGLSEGEMVVVSAGFLIDSESKIRTGNGNVNHIHESEEDKPSSEKELNREDSLKKLNNHKH